MNPRYPIYIVSKGRWDTRLTSKTLHAMGVPHNIVVEEQEADRYRQAVDSTASVIVLDPKYQRDYDTCDDLSDSKSKGPGPARNFALDHSKAAGASWHWVMDDNIRGFYRWNQNFKIPCVDPTIIRCMEDFVERYSNVMMAGPNYFMFASRKHIKPPFILNTRIYSCNLIRNDIAYRWRGRYNEDTDLSLRILKDGLCTILFNAFLQYKMPTQQMKGGNTKEFYASEGTLPKSMIQINLHPDISRLVWRFNRWHHYVDYSVFKQRLIRKPGLKIQEGINNFGMNFQEKDESNQWVTREKVSHG